MSLDIFILTPWRVQILFSSPYASSEKVGNHNACTPSTNVIMQSLPTAPRIKYEQCTLVSRALVYLSNSFVSTPAPKFNGTAVAHQSYTLPPSSLDFCLKPFCSLNSTTPVAYILPSLTNSFSPWVSDKYHFLFFLSPTPFLPSLGQDPPACSISTLLTLFHPWSPVSQRAVAFPPVLLLIAQ